MRWRNLLDRSADERRTLLCIGLDTDMERLRREGAGHLTQFEINREIVQNTWETAAAYKLNMAFYEAEGAGGISDLKKTVDLIKEEHPEILVILDAKKGDIGNTSKAYARAAFRHLNVDSVTLNAYMGRDAVDPFSEDPDRLSFVLCRTSNRAASEVQDHGDEEKMYIRMARLVKKWNDNGNLGLVVGATFPEEISTVRSVVGNDMPILVPGVGAQGGDLSKVLELGTDEKGGNVLINVSRGIMFAFSKDDAPVSDLGSYSKEAARSYCDDIKEELERCGRW